MAKTRGLPAVLVSALVVIAAAQVARADELAGAALVEALRAGGYTIYVRHAATDWGQHDRVAAAGDWTSCEPSEMRQLSAEGREAARRLGAAIRALAIPVAKVLSSEYCRAVETARLMDLGPVATTREIMNTRAAEYVGGLEAAIRRARRVLATRPAEGANTVIVGHGNLMRAATGAYPEEGGSGVFAADPDAPHGFVLVALLSADDWLRLAERFARDG
ncbi:MAG TPA: histidine phosphatase family protein [Alphaproteobacteria bacterium]